MVANPQIKAASKVTTQEVPPHLLPVVPTRQATVNSSDGSITEVVAQAFTDRILVLITQVGKIGSLIQTQTPTSLFLPSAQSDEPDHTMTAAETSSLPAPSPSTTLSHLFGTPPHGYATLYDMYASQVAAIVASDLAKLHEDSASSRPVVVGLGLKLLRRRPEGTDGDDDGDDDMDVLLGEGERARFLEIMKAVAQCRVW